MDKPETMMIDDVKYVRADAVKQEPTKDGLTLCIVRTYSAGVFLAWVDYEKCDFFNCKLVDCVRLWKWAGAFTLSELAVNGTSEPKNCRFAEVVVPEQRINRVIEMIPVTEKANETFSNAKRG